MRMRGSAQSRPQLPFPPPGVLAVYAGEDLARDGLGTIPCLSGVTNRDGSSSVMPPHPAIARDRVRHVGDTVAMVVAESVAAARDAAELIAVDYEPLSAAVDTEHALDSGQPLVWDEAPGNLCFDWEVGDGAAVAQCDDRGASSHCAGARQQPRRRQFDGAARRDRRIRSG
jgi:CO/xanthine dehydrogenase Mo-binding subunit